MDSMFRPIRCALRRKLARRSSSPAYSPPLRVDSSFTFLVVSTTSSSYSEWEKVVGIEVLLCEFVKFLGFFEAEDCGRIEILSNPDSVSRSAGRVEHDGVFIDDHSEKVSQHRTGLLAHVDGFLSPRCGAYVRYGGDNFAVSSRSKEGGLIDAAGSALGIRQNAGVITFEPDEGEGVDFPSHFLKSLAGDHVIVH